MVKVKQGMRVLGAQGWKASIQLHGMDTIQLAIALLEHYSYVTILWDIAISISDSIYYTHYFGGILEVFEGQPGGGKEGG